MVPSSASVCVTVVQTFVFFLSRFRREVSPLVPSSASGCVTEVRKFVLFLCVFGAMCLRWYRRAPLFALPMYRNLYFSFACSARGAPVGTVERLWLRYRSSDICILLSRFRREVPPLVLSSTSVSVTDVQKFVFVSCVFGARCPRWYCRAPLFALPKYSN